jgi:NAD(P)H dehydrogenase (quinone)
MSKINILVTAAAGVTSNAVSRHVLDLADKSKYHIRGGARSESKVKELVQKGAEYIKFDFSDKKSVEEGLKGVDYLWVTIPNTPKDNPSINMSQLIVGFIDQAKAANVKHVVFGTVEGADDPTKTFVIANDFRAVEKRLQEHSIPTTYIRMGWFQENVVTYHAEEITQGTYVEPIGDSKYTQVSVEDIGAAAATVLLDPKNHVGKSYTLTGPRALGGEDIAKALSEVLQRPIQFVNPSLEETKQALQSMQMPSEQIKFTIELYEIIRSGVVTHVSNDFTTLTGKQYITIEETFKQLKQSGLLK